tara:strand:- start:72 stop:632 length:561 start_codon:yes stop_codon:yes gene_type:complete
MRKGSRTCKRKPGPKKGSRRRRRSYRINHNEFYDNLPNNEPRRYRVKSRQSAHSRLGGRSGVPTAAEIAARNRRFNQTVSNQPRLITVKEVVQGLGISVDQKTLGKIGKLVQKTFKKKRGAKSGLKKKELTQIKVGKIKLLDVTAYHDTAGNRKLIEMVVKAIQGGYDDVDEYVEDNLSIRGNMLL